MYNVMYMYLYSVSSPVMSCFAGVAVVGACVW